MGQSRRSAQRMRRNVLVKERHLGVCPLLLSRETGRRRFAKLERPGNVRGRGTGEVQMDTD